jgi:hypothetical protein
MMTEAKILQRGDLVPHVEVRAVDGRLFRYSAIWQRGSLVLVALPAAGPGGAYAAELAARTADFQDRNAVCVVTRDPVDGLPAPGALVADRWGEVVHAAAARGVDGLPSAPELLEWLDYVERRCPECEGEAR